MLRSRMHSALTLFTFTGLLAAGCGKANSPNFDKGRGTYFTKPAIKDFQGVPANFAGTWSGTCSLNDGGQQQSDCGLSMTFHQMQLLAAGRASLSFDFRFRMNYQERQLSSATYLISENNLTDGTNNVGQIGRGALRIPLEKNFQSLVIRVVNSRQIAVMAAKAPSMNFEFDLASKSSACPDGYCFTALLEKQ